MYRGGFAPTQPLCFLLSQALRCSWFYFFPIGKENLWLGSSEDQIYESAEPIFLELHATAMLSLPSGGCMPPDATSCAALMSALYASVCEEEVLNRQLMVHFFTFSLFRLQKWRETSTIKIRNVLVGIYRNFNNIYMFQSVRRPSNEVETYAMFGSPNLVIM